MRSDLDAIDPDFAYALDPRGDIALQEGDQALPLIRMSGGDDHRHEEPERVNEARSFAPLHLLVPIKADVLPLRRGLDTLTIGTTPRARAGAPGPAVPTGAGAP
jgi:hypothetical protein